MENSNTLVTAPQALWLISLLSGKYQMTGERYPYLRESDGYTPLGVLCELARDADIIEGYDPMQDAPPSATKWVNFRVPYRASFSINSTDRSFVQTASLMAQYWTDLFDNSQLDYQVYGPIAR